MPDPRHKDSVFRGIAMALALFFLTVLCIGGMTWLALALVSMFKFKP